MLLDHLHSPLKDSRPWSGFFGMWAPNIARALNHTLPDGWIAAPTVKWNIEVDVGTFEQIGARSRSTSEAGFLPEFAIPEPTQTIDFAFTTDVVEVRIYHELGDLELVGAMEFVSPGNKDRPESREAIVSKCDAYLRDAVGLIIVDIVTTYQANLHAELMQRLGELDSQESPLYAVAYRPLRRDDGTALSFWYRPLQIEQPLPDMLLFLKNGPVVEVPLAETYLQTCRDFKISGN